MFAVSNICPPKSNGDLKFHCSNGVDCVAQNKYLDESKDCVDGSDEGWSTFIFCYVQTVFQSWCIKTNIAI